MTFKSLKEMLGASQALYEKGVNCVDCTPDYVSVRTEDEFEIASSVLAEYDVELVLKPLAPPRRSKMEDEVEKSISFKDILNIFKM